jgi:hypothetical protein
MKRFHYMQAYTNTMYNGITEFYSYDSHVADYHEKKRMIILYPKWQYSPTTIRQVKRFIKEYTGIYLSVYDLREAMKKQVKCNMDYICIVNSDLTLQFSRR